MAKILLAALALVIIILAGGFVALAVWDIPAPAQHVEHVIPDARFAK